MKCILHQKFRNWLLLKQCAALWLGMDKLTWVYSKVLSLKSTCIQVDRKYQIQMIIIRK